MVSESYFITSFTKIISIFHKKDIFAQKQHFLQIQNFFQPDIFVQNNILTKLAFLDQNSHFTPGWSHFCPKTSFLSEFLSSFLSETVIFPDSAQKIFFPNQHFCPKPHFYGASIFCPKLNRGSQFQKLKNPFFQKLKFLSKFKFSEKSCTEQFYHFLPIICISHHKNKYRF